MKTKIIRIPLYTGSIVLIQLEKELDLKVVTEKYNMLPNVSEYDGIAFRDNGKYIIAVTQKIKPSVIAHESFHAVGYIFEDHSIVIDIKNDEPAAYLLEWIVEQCHKYFKVKY